MYRFGLKLWSINDDYLARASELYLQGVYDYIELYVVPKTYEKFSKLWQQLEVPFVIHAPHFKHGMNLARSECYQNNICLTEEVFKWANILSADKIIYHPGVGGDILETSRQLKLINDERICIENKPYWSVDKKHVCNGSSVEDIRLLMDLSKVNFCLDVGHAFCYARSMQLDRHSILDLFLTCNPSIYHLSDGLVSSDVDQHLNIGLGDFDFKNILLKIEPASLVSIETQKKSENGLNDFLNDVTALRGLALEHLKFRPATMNDFDDLLKWRNDPLTREQSLDRHLVSKSEHECWLAHSLVSESRRVFIAEFSHFLVGTVRFDKDVECDLWEMSWTVAPRYRNCHIGKIMLKKATSLVSGELIAKIKHDNYASKKIASAAGFVNVGNNDDICLFHLNK